MKLILALCSVVGWYFLLNLFPSLHTSVLGHAFGLTFMWFHALLFGGSAVLVSVCLK